jgi:hypothetical protein
VGGEEITERPEQKRAPADAAEAALCHRENLDDEKEYDNGVGAHSSGEPVDERRSPPGQPVRNVTVECHDGPRRLSHTEPSAAVKINPVVAPSRVVTTRGS